MQSQAFLRARSSSARDCSASSAVRSTSSLFTAALAARLAFPFWVARVRFCSSQAASAAVSLSDAAGSHVHSSYLMTGAIGLMTGAIGLMTGAIGSA